MKTFSFSIADDRGPKLSLTEKRNEDLQALCIKQNKRRATLKKLILASNESEILSEWEEICSLREVINDRFESERLSAVGDTNEKFLAAVDELLEKLKNASTEELLTSDNYVLREIGKRIQEG